MHAGQATSTWWQDETHDGSLGRRQGNGTALPADARCFIGLNRIEPRGSPLLLFDQGVDRFVG
jgi:hypothetical protein